jgi:hypothetical protein
MEASSMIIAAATAATIVSDSVDIFYVSYDVMYSLFFFFFFFFSA